MTQETHSSNTPFGRSWPKPLHPGAKEGNRQVVWGDLAEIDNAGSPDRDSLWHYWLKLVEYYAALGFSGFRCDAAYKVPADLWRFLISQVKGAHPDTLFFAESLGCPIEDTLRLAHQLLPDLRKRLHSVLSSPLMFAHRGVTGVRLHFGK